MKYAPVFPERFGCLGDARAFMDTFATAYNHEHHHTGIGLHTPADVHHGHAAAVREARGQTLSVAYAATPERFVRKHPEPPDLPGTAWINRPDEADSTTESRNLLKKVDRFREAALHDFVNNYLARMEG